MEFHASRGLRVKALEDQPVVEDEYVWFWQAFSRLGSGRQNGLGQGGISHEATMAYADRMDYTQDMADMLWDVIKQLDVFYLRRTAPKPPAPPPRPRGR